LHSRSRYFAGIDGGATKTICLISDVYGEILGKGVSGPSNHHNLGLKEALSAIRDAVDDSKRNGGIRESLDVACFGLAGLDSSLDFRRIKGGLDSMKLAKVSLLVHDATATLTGALKGEPGIVVIAGTGSVAAGINERGKRTRVGGWGYIAGDEGSAYDIGKKALIAALRAYDGRGAQTALLESLVTRLKIKEPEGIIESLYIRRMDVKEIASLSPLVVQAAKEGDEVARKIIMQASEALAELAVTAARKLGFHGKRFKIAVSGGVFGAEEVVSSFKRMIRESNLRAEITYPRLSPAAGALILALREGGIDTTSIIDKLEEQNG
jgi:N-acetylglucosamine kinase